MADIRKKEIEGAIKLLLADFPGQENDPAFLEESARLVESGKDPEIDGRELQIAVGRELRRRAMVNRSRDT